MKDKPIILNKDYLTRKEAQMYLGISESSFDKLVKVINVWYRGLGKNQKEIDEILKTIDDAIDIEKEDDSEETEKDE